MRKIRRTPQPSELILDLLLVLFEGPRGSGDLAEAVGDLRGQEAPLATFYRHLQRAVDSEWVAVTDTRSTDGGESTARTGPGRPERLYRITDAGVRALRAGMALQGRRVARANALGLLAEGAQ